MLPPCFAFEIRTPFAFATSIWFSPWKPDSI